jgi:biopolymer transport protein ExbB
MTILKALSSGIIGYDLIIVALIVFNILFISLRLRTISTNLDKRLKKVVYLPVEHALKDLASTQPQKVNLHQLRHMRESEDRLYHTYVSITNILPLLGILGTVIALMNIDTFTIETVSTNFMTALTSTFWGLVGATICKILEGSIVAKVETNKDNLAMLIKSVLNQSSETSKTQSGKSK